MPITDWPKAERPREKLLSCGSSTLSDAELLAIFLRTGIKGKTAVDLARDIIAYFGGLRNLLLADKKAFCKFSGLGEAKFAQLQAVIELSHRHLKETMQRGEFLKNPQSTQNYLSARLRDLPYEVFACLFLDNQHRIIEFEILFQGTINGSSVHPREVVRKTLKHNAAALILAHNHPSGIAEPSSADRHITKQLSQSLALIDVRVLDHIVVGDGECVAFSERGWI